MSGPVDSRALPLSACRVIYLVGVPRAAKAGEDLAPLRVVPVAERGRDRAGLRRPGAAPQHAVRPAEELLRVLAVGKRLEALVAVEAARGPFPHVTQHLARSGSALAGRICAGGSGAERELVEVCARRGGCVVAPGVAALGAGLVVPGCGFLPFRLGR